MDLELFRAQFPILERVAWLATPSSAPAARQVTRALHEEVDGWAASDVSWPRRDRAAQRCREQVAGLLGVEAAHVALVQSMAEAAATVAAAQPAGSRVVVGAQEYRSNLFPWLAAEERGVRVHQVPMPQGRLGAEALVAAVTEDTALVAVSDVQSATGWRTDLAAVAARCREVGAQLFVDATQSAGVLSLPGTVDPDYVAVHGYKWLLCPRGAAWLYVRPDRLGALTPLAPNPKATAHPWANSYGGPLSYAPDARKLDMSLCWPTWAGATAALDLLGSLDPVQVERHSLGLAGLLRDGAGEFGFRCLPSERPSHIVGLVVPDADAAVRALDDQGVCATARAGVLRFGFHGFNTAEDVSRALSALAAAVPSGAAR
ncbi:aminotransferase class V-fold PLP-dependent enzyme [Nonomuraea sp. NPDC000554]|uniref:aminotransferase class V-fold PLP-dependent enzyme n=1 Tax=Nonomuraea sp. NPDC000554 TaxID=3154259 RepID=UPI003320E5F8